MKYLALAIVLFAVMNSFAQPVEMNIMRMRYGNDNPYLTARSLGLAGAGIAGDDTYASVLLNPALTAYSESWLQFNTGIAIHKLEEDRSYPYYDNFGGFVDYGSYVFNKYWYSKFYGVISSRLPFDNLMDLSVTTGFIPFKDFDYDYLEEVRSDYYGDELLGYNQWRSDGEIYAIPLNVAFKPVVLGILDQEFSLAFGIGAKILTGSIEQMKKVETKTASLSGRDYELNFKKDVDNMPVIPSVGLKINFGKRFSFGASIDLPYDIEFKNKTTGPDSSMVVAKEKLSYPMRLKFGTEYRFQNILEARIFTDFIYTFWEDFEDYQNEDISFDDTYNVRAGIEHIFFNKVPFRVGFDYGTLRESKNYSQTLLSAGTGLMVENIHIDMAGGISSLKYKQGDLFDDAIYNMETRSELDQVRWNHFYGRIDINYAF
jgi:hypothetical protein